jgi:hypothetical protein
MRGGRQLAACPRDSPTAGDPLLLVAWRRATVELAQGKIIWNVVNEKGFPPLTDS